MIKFDNIEIDGSRLHFRYTLTMQDTHGRLESMFNARIGVLVSELIRLRDGHNWKVIKDIKRERGYLSKDKLSFFPVTD